MRRLAWLTAVLTGALVGAGCVTPAQVPPVLGVANGTTMSLQVVAGGSLVAEVAPGETKAIPLADLPALPWDVEVRTSTGRFVTSMHVEEDSAQSGPDANGNVFTSGAFVRVALSCGQLDLWFGSDRPGGPAPVPNAGQPGDCDP